ncbi:hypothetical protein [Natronoglycomyces albus]|uniref:DUF3352 domain-containing protein n=1 Tax=Natronoglycomyces albus TaxID=2811108 RepID=A0A895XQX2_9ACTN|nr:hypothetical protein [Natronoglycomyces albus]QSB05913.1 hypothetical protein JQS30_03025 [Natronoglycomyces albus]
MSHMPPSGGQPPHFDPNQPPPPASPTQPQPTQPQYPPPGMQQPTQPYMTAPAGGQPPMGPPPMGMGYGPMGPPPKKGNGGKIAIASVLALVLVLGVGGFFLFTNVLKGGPDPAETLPASAGFYMEVNLDPSFDQTPKLLRLMNKFDEVDIAEDRDQAIIDLFNEHAEVDFDPDADLVSWLGNRGAMAIWSDGDDPYVVFSLSSTDDSAAEAGMKRIVETSDIEPGELAYEVSDGSVLIVAGDDNAEAALSKVQTESASAPMSDSAGYNEAKGWLSGDQLITFWADLDELQESGYAEIFGGEDFAELTNDDDFTGSIIMGFRAFDDGFETQYRVYSDDEAMLPGDSDLLNRMGELPAAPLAASLTLPEDLPQQTEDFIGLFEELAMGPGDSMDDWDTGWDDYDREGALTDAEWDELQELQLMWDEDIMSLSNEEFDRYLELDTRYILYGLESDNPGGAGDPIGAGGPDFQELMEILAGSNVTVAVGGNADADEFAIELAANLKSGQGDALDQWLHSAGLATGPDAGSLDGDRYTLSEGNLNYDSLANDSRFTSFAADAPGNAALALWIDIAEFENSLIPSDPWSDSESSDVAPLTVFAWAHGAEDGDDVGLVRMYLE